MSRMMMFMAFALIGHPLLASGDAAPAGLSPDQRTAIVNTVAGGFEQHYIFEETGKTMGDHLRQKLAGGGYDPITGMDAIIAQLTEDAQSISHDKHIKIYPYQEHHAWSCSPMHHGRASLQLSNQGFRKCTDELRGIYQDHIQS